MDNDVSYNYELNIYRIIQELVNNAIKHSNCKEVRIRLHQVEENIILIVSDDGIGSTPKQKRNGIGLYNIKNRLASLNGKLKIETSKNKGFKVVISIPFVKAQVPTYS